MKYGGIYVPAHNGRHSPVHARNVCGLRPNDLARTSHTRYGAIGTLGIGEGGGELVKQLLGRPYVIAPPEVVLVYLTGRPLTASARRIIALAIIGAVFKNGL